MSQITTHILDISRGLPAPNVPVTLFQQDDQNQWKELANGVTDSNGRISDLLDTKRTLSAGCYRLHFTTQVYYDSNNEIGFFPYVDIVFVIDDTLKDKKPSHYHIPLLLAAYSYSTYRGS